MTFYFAQPPSRSFYNPSPVSGIRAAPRWTTQPPRAQGSRKLNGIISRHCCRLLFHIPARAVTLAWAVLFKCQKAFAHYHVAPIGPYSPQLVGAAIPRRTATPIATVRQASTQVPNVKYQKTSRFLAQLFL